MKILGLLFVAFFSVGLSTLLGFSENASLFGAMIAVGYYAMENANEK